MALTDRIARCVFGSTWSEDLKFSNRSDLRVEAALQNILWALCGGEVSVRGAFVFTTHNTFPQRYFAIFEVNPRKTTVTSADLTEARQVRAAYLLGKDSLSRYLSLRRLIGRRKNVLQNLQSFRGSTHEEEDIRVHTSIFESAGRGGVLRRFSEHSRSRACRAAWIRRSNPCARGTNHACEVASHGRTLGIIRNHEQKLPEMHRGVGYAYSCNKVY